MRILLTHGYFLAEDEKEQVIMRPYPPLGLLYISGYLKQKEVAHEVYDSTFSNIDSLKKYLVEYRPDVVALYTNLMTKINVIKLMGFMKSTESLKHTKIVLGGPDVTYNIENYLNAGADYMVIGEGEETFYQLVNQLQNGGDVGEVDGLAFCKSGEVFKTSARMKLKNLDELPLPNRSEIPIEKYLSAWKQAHGENALNVSTQRGCPYTCKWCSTAVYGQSYRRRSPEKVVEELALLQEQYNPDTFWLVDDVFTVSHKWLKAFHAEIQRTNLKIKYECITRAERMNEEVIGWLKESGCIRVWIGAESGSQKIIDAMDRRVSVEQVKDMLIKTRHAGIETGTFIMVGYPGETMEDIKATATYLEEALPDYFTVTKSYPIKGTALYEEIEDSITQQPEWSTSTDREIDFKRAYSDRFYTMAIRYISNRVQLKKANGNPVQKAKTKLKIAASNVGMLLLR